MVQRLLNLVADKSTWQQVRKFAIVSATSASITLGIPIFLHEILGVDEKIAVLAAFVIAYLVNFLSLRRLVFDSAGSMRADFLKFAGSTLAFRTTEYLLFLLLHEIFGIVYIIALLVILTGSTFAKFFWYRKLFSGVRRGS